ncbi:Tyrosine-protein kinase PR2 [Eumeta japonica]|uniref:Tyrosine-protein kinase PR2 n=1 Tax=Eumeta variegata TaxID=151549 RepID=A0A4C1SBH9_EUMVA|nr:Tyrosine-protein kinase PR2 [Eumeta japonica]
MIAMSLFPTIPLRLAENEQDMIIPPLQNAPRPTTLPTRGAANRLRKAEMGLLHESPQIEAHHEQAAMNNRVADNISPCESPSYVTTTATYKFPEQSQNGAAGEQNALPQLPPKEGKKHIKANPKRHVRKYPLIIPANGVQRTLSRVMMDEQTKLN